MKRIQYLISFTICLLLLHTGCAEDPKMPDNLIGADKPVVILQEEESANHITATQATVYGKIENENGAKVTEKGFIWNIEGESTQWSSSAVTDEANGVFYLNLEGLKDSTDYQVLAYAKNAMGESRTELWAFKTVSGLARVKTISEPVKLRATSAILNGEITNPGYGTLLEKGIAYREISAQAYTQVPASSESGNTFEAELTGLSVETEYVARAYVRNDFGTTHGSEVRFTTTNGKPRIEDFLLEERQESYALFRADITDEGDAPVTARGFVYSQTKDDLIHSGTTILSGEGLGVFSEQITELEPQKLYYIIAFATNQYGTVLTDTLEFVLKSNAPTVITKEISIVQSGVLEMGGTVFDLGDDATLKTSGIVYSTTPNPTLEQGIKRESGLEDILFRVDNIRGGTSYYVRAFATNNKGETALGEVKTIRTPDIYSVEATFPGAYIMDGTSTSLSIQKTNKGYLIGGDKGAQLSRECWEFDPVAKSWKNLTSLNLGLSGHASVYNQTVIVSFGGITDNRQATNKTYAHTFIDWREIVPNNTPPSPRYNISGAYYNSAMYILGGITQNGEIEEVSNEVWSFQVFPPDWKKKPDMPQAQYKPLSFAIGNSLYAGLGLTAVGDMSSYSNRFFVYREANQQWRELAAMPGGKAVGGTVIDGIIYVADEQGYLHTYNSTENTWRTISTRIPTANRKIHCMFGFNRNAKVYIGLGDYTTQLISYDPGWDN